MLAVHARITKQDLLSSGLGLPLYRETVKFHPKLAAPLKGCLYFCLSGSKYDFQVLSFKKKKTKKPHCFAALGNLCLIPCTSSWHQGDPRGFWDLSLDLSRAGELHARVSWKSSVSFCSFPELLLHESQPHFVPLLHLLLMKKMCRHAVK